MRIPLIRSVFDFYAMYKWNKNKNSNPPQCFKYKTLIQIAAENNLSHIIETGTYLGDMINATLNTFKKIDSIELSKELSVAAQRRFKKSTHVKIWNGDSPEILPKIITSITDPCLFWLDAHYSSGITARSENGDTPITEELSLILHNWIFGNVILIDDARCFTGQDNYPTIPQLYQFIESFPLNLSIEVKDDIIRIKDAASSPNAQ